MEPTNPEPEQTTPAPPEMTPTSDPAPETIEPAAQLEPTPPRKRSVKKIILIVLGIFVLIILLLIGGVLFYLQRQGLTPDKLSPQPKTPATTIAPKNSTTNIYQNQNYKFSMPIPSDVTVKEAPYGFGITSVEMREKNASPDDGPDIQVLLFPKPLGAAIGQDFNKYYDAPENTTNEIKDPSGGTVQFTKIRNRMVNNLRAFEFKSKALPVEPDVEGEVGAYIEMGTDVMVLSTGESNKAKLDAMLADFKYPL